jgi:hypothetical protein
MNTHFVHSEYHSLSIRIFSDGFSLWLKDNHQKSVFFKNITFSHYQSINDIPDLLMQQTEINKNVGNISFIIETDFYDIIPTNVFKEENANDFLRFKYPEITDQLRIITKEFQLFGVTMLFSIPENLYEFLTEEFPASTFIFHPELILKELAPISIPQIMLFQRKRNVDIGICINQQIAVLNHFNYKTQEDIIYQVMNFIQTMNIPENKYILKLFCEDTNSILPQKLSEFCKITETESVQQLHENY